MKKGIVHLAVVPQRAEPSDRSEMVSQLLFGDTVNIIDKSEQWLLVSNTFDDYVGWINEKQIIESKEYIPAGNDWYITGFNAYNTLIKSDKSNIFLPPGCTLPGYQLQTCDIGIESFEVDAEVIHVNKAEKNDWRANALFYLNTPYLWGGKTHYGIDCSGFTQIIFKSLGLRLKRDASLQAEQGQSIDFLAETQPGDLAFFDNEEGKIIHVGILLSENEIIHASGKVRIDPIDHEGIVNSSTGKRSHTLRIIKRML